MEGVAVGLNQSNNKQLAADIGEPGVEHPFDVNNVLGNAAISGAFGLGAGMLGGFAKNRVRALRDIDKNPKIAHDLKALETYNDGKPVTSWLDGATAPKIVTDQYDAAKAEQLLKGRNVVAGTQKAQEAATMMASELKGKLHQRAVGLSEQKQSLYSAHANNWQPVPVMTNVQGLSRRLLDAGDPLGERLERLLRSHGGTGKAEDMLYNPQRLDDTIEVLGSRETGGLSSSKFQGEVNQLAESLRAYRKLWPGFDEMNQHQRQVMEASKSELQRLGLSPNLTAEGIDQSVVMTLDGRLRAGVSGKDRYVADSLDKPPVPGMNEAAPDAAGQAASVMGRVDSGPAGATGEGAETAGLELWSPPQPPGLQQGPQPLGLRQGRELESVGPDGLSLRAEPETGIELFDSLGAPRSGPGFDYSYEAAQRGSARPMPGPGPGPAAPQGQAPFYSAVDDAVAPPMGPYPEYPLGFSPEVQELAKQAEAVGAYQRLSGKAELDVGTTAGIPPGVRLGYANIAQTLKPRMDPAFRAMSKLQNIPGGVTGTAASTAALMPWVAKLLEMGGVPVAKTDDKPAKSK